MAATDAEVGHRTTGGATLKPRTIEVSTATAARDGARCECIGALVSAYAARAISLLELLDNLRGHDEATLWVTPPDPHPNARAHALAADAVFEKLKTDFGLP